MASETLVIVTARDEADRIAATLAALARAFPGAAIFLADDGSADGTGALARGLGAQVVQTERPSGKGGAATLAARSALAAAARSEDRPGTGVARASRPHAVFVLCDGDLGDSAVQLPELARAVREGRADMAVARFKRRAGGGFGLVVAMARWAIRRGCGFDAGAPLSGQRALREETLRQALPFAEGFGMEVGITIDAVRAGHTVQEIELDLAHRASGRTPAGFLHRARQLLDVLRAYRARRRAVR